MLITIIDTIDVKTLGRVGRDMWLLLLNLISKKRKN